MEANSTAAKVSRTLRAIHTADVVRVYQAYGDAIADAVLEGNSFRAALDAGLWSASRMTWIKPSKVWMAYRCGWTVLKDRGQSRVLAIDLRRTAFDDLLARGTLSGAGGGDGRGGDGRDGDGGGKTKKTKTKCRNSPVVVQWDPERTIVPSENGRKAYTQAVPHVRSIQIGLRPPANEVLLDPSAVVGIEDVTDDFRSAVEALQRGGDVDEAAALLWPDGRGETVLRVPRAIEERLDVAPRCASGTGDDAVIVLGCAANPVHRGHFHCLKAAKVEAERRGHNVLWTTIAPAPFGYVKHKMERRARSAAAAAAGDGPIEDAPGEATIALDDDTRMRVVRTMASQTMARDPSLAFRMPERTYGSALECGRALRPSPDVKAIVVVGGDRFDWTRTSRPDATTFGCARDEAQFATLGAGLEEAVREGRVADPGRWVLVPGVGPRTSSTVVRGMLADAESSAAEKAERLRREGYSVHAANALINHVSVKTDI